MTIHSPIMQPTRDDLAALLKAKIEAQMAYSEARVEVTAGVKAGASIEERVCLDLREREALKASVAADAAYNAALDRFTGITYEAVS